MLREFSVSLRVSCHYYCDLMNSWPDEQASCCKETEFSSKKDYPCLPNPALLGRIRTVVAVNPADMGCNIVNYHLFCSLDEK